MDFSLTEEQSMFQRMVREFAEKEIKPICLECDEQEKFPAEQVKRMGELGLMGVTIDEKYGGVGGDSIQQAIIVEELSRVSTAMGTIHIGCCSLGTYPVYTWGSEELKQKYVVPLAKGEKIGCFALTESGAGSDVVALETTATKKGDYYILNGVKTFISNGAEAEIITTFATIDKSLKHRGICAFMVESSLSGYSVGKKEKKLGIRATSTTELILNNCQVPVENLIGGEGRGFYVALGTIDSSRITVAAQGVGTAQGAFEAALSFAKERKQFGQPIANFQAIQWMLADMATSIEAARLLTYQAAWLKDQSPEKEGILPWVKQAAMAKVFASETAMAVTTKAIQIHGGYGYVKEYPVERFFRDAKILEIYEGTSEMQRMTIARSLLR